MLLQYAQDVSDEQMASDIHSLNELNHNAFNGFIKVLFNFLSNPTQAGLLMEQLHTYANEVDVNVSALRTIVRTMLTIFKGALRLNVSPTRLSADLTSVGLDKERASSISNLWKANFISMSRAVVANTLTVNQLVDMEWRFGVISASSEQRKVGNTYLQLKLVLDKGNGDLKDVHMELTLPQFYDFLHQMEKTKSSLEYLS